MSFLPSSSARRREWDERKGARLRGPACILVLSDPPGRAAWTTPHTTRQWCWACGPGEGPLRPAPRRQAQRARACAATPRRVCGLAKEATHASPCTRRTLHALCGEQAQQARSLANVFGQHRASSASCTRPPKKGKQRSVAPHRSRRARSSARSLPCFSLTFLFRRARPNS